MKWLKNILLFLGVFFFMVRLRRWLIAFSLRLSPPRNRVVFQRGLRVPMSDGVMLTADLYSPRKIGNYPTIVIRSPYGRNPQDSIYGWVLAFMANRFTERGYHVLVQDVRGRFGSDGTFEPYLNERADGKATIDWLKRQPWFNGQIGTWGASYIGIAQWLLACDSPEVQAIIPTITGSNLHKVLYPDGAFDLSLAMRWISVLGMLEDMRGNYWRRAGSMWGEIDRTIKPAYQTLPISDCDMTIRGESVPFYHFWLENADIHADLWQQAIRECDLSKVSASVHLIGGWYDFFLRALLDDYETLRANGKIPYLTIGPWHHFTTMGSLADVREGVVWMDAQLKGKTHSLRDAPVSLYLMGANEWRDYEYWPPTSRATAFYLQPAAELSKQAPKVRSAFDQYTYDPSDPTPYIGGTAFSPFSAGRTENRLVEAREDVLLYTSLPLDRALEVIGRVSLKLYVQSSVTHTDFYGRLCDVYPNGKSYNVCDGLFRVSPGAGELQPDGTLLIEIDLWATAHRFKRGHRLRLQVASAAHPRWSRNLNTPDPFQTASTPCIADQTIFHDAAHPSALVLPVT